MKKIIAAALLTLARSSVGAWAQGTPPPSDIARDRQEVRADLEEMQTLDAKHADAVKDLNAQEKAAMEAVKDDASLTPERRKEQLAAVRENFNARRRTLNETFRADKRKILADLKKDRADIRKDEGGLRAERRGLHRNMRREMRERREAGGRR